MFEVTPCRMSASDFLECMTNITFIRSYTKSLYYMVLCSINIVFGIISFSRYWKNVKLPTHQRKKEPCTGGADTAFLLQLGGQENELGGQVPL